VRTLVNEQKTGGPHDVTWDGKNDRGDATASDVYFCVLDAGTARMTKKLVSLK
jgi:flagellar hook assembly protein FlgD